MSIGKTSSAVKNRYNAKTYDRITVCVPKATGAAFKAKCEQQGTTQSKVIKSAIEKFLAEE